MSSAETLTMDGWKMFAHDLPIHVEHHCMVLVDDLNIMVIGGHTRDQGMYGSATHFYNFDSQSWKDGPSLILGRSYHSCGMIKKDQDSNEVKL